MPRRCRYNVGGAVLWSVLFVGAGYFFGNLPFVQVCCSVTQQVACSSVQCASQVAACIHIHTCSPVLSPVGCVLTLRFIVQHNFTLVVLAIVAVSVLPIVFEVLAARREQQADTQ